MSVPRKKKITPEVVEEKVESAETTTVVVETPVQPEKKAEVTIEERLERISTHLVFLEKKLDTLLEQSKNQRPPFQSGFVKREFQGPRPGGHRPHDGRPYHSKFGGGQNRDRFHGNFAPRPAQGSDGYYQKKYHSHHTPHHPVPHHPSAG